ncbi:MAG: hypothetical protein Greene041679_517 [Parcubacteria group bacterium Greene0416_79]|nr:MAG: hypothetical protein Greene041679_517 [Parcubacteria group bacterium Greene0416_79]TSD02872.1 MAG: hypothetical protein Greene071436_380 [Parcubacteria group bacterium Greene0714_36]
MRDPYKFNAAQYDLSLLKRAGTDVFISAHVEIRRPSLVSLGSHIAIDSGFYITTQGEFGDYIHIGPGVTVIGGFEGELILEGFNTIGAGTKIICASDTFSGNALVTTPGIPPQMVEVIAKLVIVKKFANIGVNVIIFPGVIVGEGSVVGAGSVVRHDTKPWTIYAGNPARPIKKRPKEKMLTLAKKLTARK